MTAVLLQSARLGARRGAAFPSFYATLAATVARGDTRAAVPIGTARHYGLLAVPVPRPRHGGTVRHGTAGRRAA
jgi:hypothetical protein